MYTNSENFSIFSNILGLVKRKYLQKYVSSLISMTSRRQAWQPTPVFLPGEPPWTEEPGRLQSMGLQRVRHDWATRHTAQAAPYCLSILLFYQFVNCSSWILLLLPPEPALDKQVLKSCLFLKMLFIFCAIWLPCKLSCLIDTRNVMDF